MKELFKNRKILNNIVGILYILAALFYASDLTVPFCITMIFVIVLLLLSFSNKQEAIKKAADLNIKDLGMLLFVLVLIIKML